MKLASKAARVFDLRAFVGSFVCAFVVLSGLSSASAHDTSGWVPIGQTKIYNWDYKSNNTSWSNKDWPINVIFFNNSDPHTVKANRQDIFAYNCNVLTFCNMKHRSFDARPGGGWAWDTDGGRKEFRCGWLGGPPDVWTLHYRAYENESWYTAASANDQMPLWDPGWGYITPVSAHYDIDDPGIIGTACDATAHGYDETAEGWIVGHYSAIPGWWGINDWTVHFHNSPPALRIIEGREHWGNGNGSSSVIYVP